jgi:hypothetical protein
MPSDATRVGVARVDEWAEIRARSRVEALEKIAAGDGKRLRRKGGKIVDA